MKKAKIKVPIFPSTIYLFEYKDVNQFDKEYKNYSFDVDTRGFHAGVFELSNGIHMVFHNDGKLTPGMIAHECKHAVNLIFANIKYQLDETNDEVECYLLQWLIDEVYKKINFKL